MTAPGAAGVWFTSDLHFGHANILTYSERPFDDVRDMEESLILNWNACVQPGDRVYMLGDFALCDVERATKIAKRLNGQKFLIFGNHDKRLRKDKEFLSLWVWARDLESIEVDGQKLVLCHYPMVTWHGSHRGAWMLHGHCHGSLRDDPHALRVDVGVDAWQYMPVSFEEVANRMSKKTFKPVDHHGARGDGY